jgi:cytochrome b subunit of formate dehydrogenase
MVRGLIVKVRGVAVILLVVLGFLTLITGMILATAPKGAGSGGLEALGLAKNEWRVVHTYVAFSTAGTAIVHAYTNYRGILYHLGLWRRRRDYKAGVVQGCIS